MQIGDKLRTARLQKHLTLDELSRAAGVSKSMLSNVERDLSASTITTLQKIASALGLDPASLFRDRPLDASAADNGSEATPASVIHNGERGRVLMPWGATYELLCPDMQHRIECISMDYPVGGGSHELYSHEGEECGVVLQGRFKGIVGDQEFVLEAGDSIYYASTIPHRWENAGDVEAKAIWAITPPSF